MIKIEEIPKTKCYQITQDGVYAGCCLITDDGDAVILWQLYIKNKFRGLGLGKKLMEHVIQDQKKDIYLIANPFGEEVMDIPDLERWYESLGFVKCLTDMMVYKV